MLCINTSFIFCYHRLHCRNDVVTRPRGIPVAALCPTPREAAHKQADKLLISSASFGVTGGRQANGVITRAVAVCVGEVGWTE